MEDTKLAWHWVVESLADVKEVEIPALKDLIVRDPEVLDDSFYGTETSERVALRYLEECADLSFASGSLPPSASDLPSTSSCREIELAQPSENFLYRHLQKVTTLGKSEMSKNWEYVYNLRQYILLKRATSPKSSLGLLKDSIVENSHQGALSLEYSVFNTVYKVNNLICDSNEEHTNKLQWENNNTDIQPLKLVPAATCPDNGNALFQQHSSGSEKHFCEQNLSDGDEIGTRGKHKKERFNKTQSKKQIATQSHGDKNKQLVPFQRIEGESSVVPESSTDVDRYHESDIDQDNEILNAENHKLLSSQNPITQDSLRGVWTVEKLCIKCDKGGRLLVCTASNCPIMVHESCLGSSLNIADGGNFYCPFCSYSRAVAAYSKAKCQVSVARNALSCFIGGDHVDHREVPNLTFPSEPSPARRHHGNEMYISQSKEMMKANKRQKQVKAPGDSISNDNICTREADNHKNAILDTMELETANHHSDEVVAHQQGTVSSAACIGNTVCREAFTTSISGHHDSAICVEAEISNKQQCQRLLEGNQQTESASAFGHNCLFTDQGETSQIKEMQHRSADVERCLNSNVLDQCLKHQSKAEAVTDHNYDGSTCQEMPASNVHKEHRKTRREDAVSQKTFLTQEARQNQRVNDSPSKNRSYKTVVKVSKRYSNIMYPCKRRSKLAWTSEEEEALKEGIAKFPHGDRGHPWSQIFEYGRSVFHKTRTPHDLKDKWRNIKIKESVKE